MSHVNWIGVGFLALSLAFAAGSSLAEDQQAAADAGSSPPGMILIPAGEFVMGTDEETRQDAPAHVVLVDRFWLDSTEVTNAQYFSFCQATGHKLPELWGQADFHSGLDFPDHPVVGVSWYDARAYAEWAGKRLPTEAEWEYAARGGLSGKRYPTGDELTDEDARYGGRSTVRVASFAANGHGLYDMAGNVWEWVADIYRHDGYGAAGEINPKGPVQGILRTIRGGSWHSGPYCLRVYHRAALVPGWVDFAVGFRCARDVGDTELGPEGQSPCGDEGCGQEDATATGPG